MGTGALSQENLSSDQVTHKPACSATDTRYKIEISLVASLDTCIILSNKGITKVLTSLHGCTGRSGPVVRKPRIQVFLRRGPYVLHYSEGIMMIKVIDYRMIMDLPFWINFVCLFDLILYVPSTIFQLNRDGSSWVEPVTSTKLG